MGKTMLPDDNLACLETFQALLPEVREYICQHAPLDWHELMSVMSVIVDEPLGPLSILPLASCAAVGGDPRGAIPVAATWEVLSLAMRILDDLQDRDRPDGLWAKVGLSRAFNFSASLYALCNKLLVQAPWPAKQYRAINRNFTQEVLRLAAGQDRDLCGETRTIEDYWHTIEEKNARAFAWACAAGALCGSDNAELVDSCRSYGQHLGIALQLFDDFEGLWEPSGMGDLEMGKITLPLVYGMSVAHERRDDLRRLVQNGQLAAQADRIHTILDDIHTREFMIWTALQEREQALAAIALCPGESGVTTLTAYITVIFANIEEILLSPESDR
jgi:geranylgeranyl diphosphate synthase type I